MQYRYNAVLRALLTIAAAGLLLHLAWTAGLGHPWADRLANVWIYSGVSVAAAAICLLRALASPQHRLAWTALGLGLAFTAFGDVYWEAAWSGQTTFPYPSVADVAYLATYPCHCFGLVLLARDRGLRLSFGALVDGLLVGLAVAAVASALLAPALAEIGHGETAKVLTSFALSH